MPNVVCQVSIPNTGRDFFHYQIMGELPAVGARVWVPFRKKERQLGIVIGYDDASSISMALKSIVSVIDKAPLISNDLLALCHWMSAYYHAPLSEILPLVLPKLYRRGDARYVHEEKPHFKLAMDVSSALGLLLPNAAKQRALVNWLGHESELKTKQDIIKAGFSTSQWSALLDRNIIIPATRSDRDVVEKPLSMNEEQAHAVLEILKCLDQYQCFLLQGVTGSGKTEVYLQVIAHVLAKKKQVLIVVPEIGLTPQLLARFRNRFRVPMAVIHSHLNDKERQVAWQNANDEQVQLVIGTRSAIFVPMPSLGLIIVDEEHDASLKQMDGVRYFARDSALMRAHMKNIPIILGSATPSLESVYNCMRSKYQLLRLNHKALNQQPLHYEIIDIRNQHLEEGLAKKTLQMIASHLNQNNQVLVFINRRGFAPVLLCHQCGWMADCKACDSHLTLHSSANRLICHHCGLSTAVLKQCGHCKQRELLPIGVGTQRLHAYLSQQFPKACILRIDRDAVRNKGALDRYLAQITNGEVNLIIGTQMLAKGHHFPRLSLVVVLDADNGFYNQDFRALEQFGQLLVQVAGRAGRDQVPGHVLIQTHLPHHPLLNLLIQEGYDSFSKALLRIRQEAQLPPYYFLALLRVQGKHQGALLQALHAIKQVLHQPSIQALGPAPAPLARKANLYRMQLLIKTPTRKARDAALTAVRAWFSKNKDIKGVRWNIDVDPMDLS